MEENVSIERSHADVTENATKNEALKLDTDLDNKLNVTLEANNRTDGECEFADNLDLSMSSVSGWYGKGCSRFRKRKKSNVLNKRSKKDIDVM